MRAHAKTCWTGVTVATPTGAEESRRKSVYSTHLCHNGLKRHVWNVPGVEVWTTVRKDQLIRPCVCDDSVNAAELKCKAWFGQYSTGSTANTNIPTGRPSLILQPLFLAF